MRDNKGYGLLLIDRDEFVNTNHIHKRRVFRADEIILNDGSSHFVCREMYRRMVKSGKQRYTEMENKKVKPKRK